MPVQIEFTIQFYPNPPSTFPDHIPLDPILTGTGSFGVLAFTDNQTPILQPQPPPIRVDIGTLSPRGTFHQVFIPTDPCFGDGSCSLGFGFNGLTSGFTTYAYLSTATLPSITPSPPPIIPIAALDFAVPNPPPIDVMGNLIAFDDPEIVGTWEVKLSVVPEPSSAMLLVSAVFGLWGRRFFTRRA